jgi:hypothetical protein
LSTKTNGRRRVGTPTPHTAQRTATAAGHGAASSQEIGPSKSLPITKTGCSGKGKGKGHVYLIGFRGTNQPQNTFFFFNFFLVRFSAFLGKGSSKTRLKNMFAQSPCRKLSPRNFLENQQKFRYQFSLDFFCFIAFSGAS